MNIRRVDARDWDDWLRMRDQLWPPDAASDTSNPDEMRQLLDNPDTHPVWVAERPQGGLCGLLEVEIRSTAEGCLTDRIGYLEGWYVDADVRQQGVGAALVAAGEAWARAQGCTEMASDTTPHYPHSPAAHAALGYHTVTFTQHFRKQLD